MLCVFDYINVECLFQQSCEESSIVLVCDFASVVAFSNQIVKGVERHIVFCSRVIKVDLQLFATYSEVAVVKLIRDIPA